MTPEQRETHAKTLTQLASCFAEGSPTHVACLAGAEALAPPPTCGTCNNWMRNHGSGWDKRHPCHFYGGVPRTADDGCILGYAPTETPR